jgi:hypothetical protein
MRVDEQVRKRATQLIERGAVIASSQPQYADPGGRAMLQECDGWLASAKNLLQVIYPDPLSSYRIQSTMLQGSKTERVGGMMEILRHLLLDVDAGVVMRIAEAARAEVFDDFLDQSEYYLRGKKVPQAGVIAGVVFEDTVRTMCDRLQIPQKGVDVEQLISALVKRGAITEVRAKRARAAAGVRTQATHAQWDEFEAEDVQAAIRVARELIDEHLS